ncbi:EXS-domain-containing protein [Trichoderma longibrachiatum ATCC 18648]|uniref:EXS-domain-containing protein n=1 Tax=Trichoderma longibrachiatum ATCC 18648 TaxID=983965 RepID=A0A2T4CA61_TRILO|nr:EXS-domain-containing protein [Trichoderma longibrachiatum ATCC 18648]
MKFAKELEREAVPEWRAKYLNYKAGKKFVKAVASAIQRTSGSTPRLLTSRRPPSFFAVASPQTEPTPHPSSRLETNRQTDETPKSTRWHGQSEPVSIAKRVEEDALSSDGNSLQYGSFVPTPPGNPQTPSQEALQDDPDDGQQEERETSHKRNQSMGTDDFFELPAPAIHTTSSSPGGKRILSPSMKSARFDLHRSSSSGPLSSGTLPNLARRDSAEETLRRLSTARESARITGFPRQSLDLVREKEQQFYAFLDSELEKVETFYKKNEDRAGERLVILREQLHEMRNRRIQEIANERANSSLSRLSHHKVDETSADRSLSWMHPLKTKIFPLGPNSKALQDMPRTPHLLGGGGRASEDRMDYVRRPENDEVAYRTAKRKLKLAMQEFYRSLELLKSYALLNRTAFRKLNKKYDKAVNARPPMRYMNEKVNKAWFVNSDVLEGHIKTVEDLYARYFERGNQKLAVGKLRKMNKKPKDESGSSFLNGFLIGTGAVFTIQGLVYGVQLLNDDDPAVRLQTSYLLQLYGGYFLMLMLFSFFCVNCYIWLQNRVNYPFIFEFDQRSQLDWRQISEFPSFFLLVFGLIMWANFSRYGDDTMFLYYPVLLIGLTVVVILFPAPVMAHKSRRWFAYSHWRLLLSGLYPVEFRDFFLGDMYCSLTYSMANIELFFCLYANHWHSPGQCNSTSSRLLGFLTTLPAIWRFLQCIRRYRDTRNIFPHLVNCGKYTATILSYVTLSMYRIGQNKSDLALFATFSTVNGLYTSVWDLFMDFSLLQPQSRHTALRDILALKYRWVYYVIMVVDPILRFSWIFYAIFTHDLQHSTIVSFLVSFMEVFRRGMWSLLRVENEHCANVAQYKASREVPLPYHIEPLLEQSTESSPMLAAQGGARPSEGPQQPRPQTTERPGTYDSGTSTAVGVPPSGSLRHRAEPASPRVARGFSKIMAEAHKQDFEKKRRPADGAGDGAGAAGQGDEFDDDDDDDDDDPDGGSLSGMRPHSGDAA